MGWLVLALLATVILTLINFGDKLIISKTIPDTNAVLIYFAFVNIVLGGGLWVLTGFPILTPVETLGFMLAGALIIWGNLFYLRAMAADDASSIIVLAQLQPVVVLVMSTLFLNEHISTVQLIGFVCILVAAVALSINRPKDIPAARRGLRGRLPQVSGAFWLMLMAAFMWGASTVVADAAIGTFVTDFETLAISIGYSSIGYAIGGALLFLLVPPVRRSFMKTVPHTNGMMLLSVTGVEGMFVARQFIYFSAISLGPVALVAVIGSTGVFFGIVLGLMLTLLLPSIFQEDIRRSTLLRKSVWAAVMFLGLILLR